MNKEFRIWRFCDADNRYKFYYTSKPFMVCGSGATLVFPTDGNHKYVDDSIQEANEEEVQQWTGLTDSTGRKIFEGDIVKWDDASNGKYWRVAQVIWHERGSWCFRIIPNKSINCFPHGQTYDYMMANFTYSPNPNEHGNVLQVIGNIFENPELLKP